MSLDRKEEPSLFFHAGGAQTDCLDLYDAESREGDYGWDGTDHK